MVELLAEVFREFGLELTSSKTKSLSTEHVEDTSIYCITDCGEIEILAKREKPKYLGRLFTGDIRNRGKVAVDHRICCGWMKHKALQHIYEDKDTPVKLRVKLFDAAISSTILYALETCPLTKNLRRLVGWISTSSDTWDVGIK